MRRVATLKGEAQVLRKVVVSSQLDTVGGARDKRQRMKG
jgi:hypothetical protein